jgi:O-antigen ligase
MNKCKYIREKAEIKPKEFNPSNKFLLITFFILPLFTVNEDIVAKIASLLMIILMLYFFFTSDFGIIFPVLLFFYSYLIAPADIVVYRVYTILYFLRVIFYYPRFRIVYAVPLVVFLLYSILCFTPISFRLMLSTVFDILFMFFFLTHEFKEGKLTAFFRFFAYTAMIAIVFGILRLTAFQKGYVYYNDEWVIFNRFIASFKDANYLGLYYNISIFSVLILDIFQGNIKKLVLMVLYGALFASVSLTGFLCNIIFFSIYYLFVKKGKVKNFFIMLGIFLCAAILFFVSLNINIPIITPLSQRLSAKWSEFVSEDYSSLTSWRTDIWKEHFEYFLNQNIFNILFGGNVVTNIQRVWLGNIVHKGVSHQEYLDLLLNVGILGFLIILFTILYLLKKDFNMLKTVPRQATFKIFLKLIWLFYAFALTMFPSSNLYIFVFI